MSVSELLHTKSRARVEKRDSLFVGKQVTREKWEILRESLPELPTFDEVEPFGGGHAFVLLLNAIEGKK